MRKKLLKYTYIILGTITLALGLLGIVTPGLPTTPFLLLTAFLYARSSDRLHKKVLTNKITGAYINKVNNGFSMKLTLFSILFMWIMISFTTFVVFKGNFNMQMIMIVSGVIGTIAQILVLRKKKKKVVQEVSSEKNNDEYE